MPINEIILAATAALTLLNKLGDLLATLKSRSEMSTDEEAAYDKFVKDRQSLPHWQPSGKNS